MVAQYLSPMLEEFASLVNILVYLWPHHWRRAALLHSVCHKMDQGLRMLFLMRPKCFLHFHLAGGSVTQ